MTEEIQEDPKPDPPIPDSPKPDSLKSDSPKPAKNKPKARSSSSMKLTHVNQKTIKLVEDFFGYHVDDDGNRYSIKRFTWTNHNCIRVQVITYGARITSLQLPNRKRQIDDVAIGFDDICGYLCNDDLHIGATVGRVTGKVQNATFAVNDKQYWLSVNDGCDHCDGGFKGLDTVLWTPYVQGSKVILSYVSKDSDEGYPGDLFIRIAFELNAKNEFSINMEAFTSRPTIVNLSHLLYFNLGGHGAGPEELRKHIVNINANCCVRLMDDGLPTGEIQNVIHTKNDFQIPKLLKDELGVESDDGFDTHLCVNRGIEQELGFVARAVHPPSGRMLEMYSNQCGVHFSTANHFGYGVVDIPISVEEKESEEVDEVFVLIKKLHSCVSNNISIDSKNNYKELNELISKLHKLRLKVAFSKASLGSESSKEENALKIIQSEAEEVIITPIQAKYLEDMLSVTRRDTPTSYTELKQTIRIILDTVVIKDELEIFSKDDLSIKNKSDKTISKEDSALKKEKTELANRCFCKKVRLQGKANAIYRKHGAMCFQSENYPNAIHHKNFPNCELRPGETYRHTIVYKFWIQSGNPNQWLKRNFPLPRN